MNKGFIKALLPLFVLVFFTLPFVSCGGGDSSSSSSDNGGADNYISLVGQWEEINVDESEAYPMKTRYTFLNDATCYEDLYIKIGNKYSRTVIIAPITTKTKASIPTHVFISSVESFPYTNFCFSLNIFIFSINIRMFL